MSRSRAPISRRSAPLGATVLVGGAAPLAVASLVLAGAPVAAAAQLGVAVGPAEAQLGDTHTASGTMLADDGTPLARRRIAIEVRPYPFTAAFRPIAHVTTGAKGRFSVDDLQLDRNYDVRAVAFDGTTSGIARAFTYPAHRLRFKALGPRRVRFVQTYRVPRDVRLTRRTLFYVGRTSFSTAGVRARGRTVRTAPGRFRSSAVVRIPRSWHGRFHYASCFRYTPGSGMGDPAQGCPSRFRFR